MFLCFQIPVETAGTMKVTPGAGSSWSTIALGYRRIESDQPKWEKVSIDLVEINMIDRYASEAGVFSRGEREDNIYVYQGWISPTITLDPTVYYVLVLKIQSTFVLPFCSFFEPLTKFNLNF